MQVLKRTTKKFEAREKAKDNREKAEALVVHLKNIESTLMDKFQKTTAEYEAKAGPVDSDLGSTQTESDEISAKVHGAQRTFNELYE